MSRDQREPRIYRLADPGEGSSTQQHAEYDRHNAESSVSAVAHNHEPLITIMAADKAVGGVGETVFVQCPGQNNTGEHRQECCRPIPEAEQLGQ